jgi:hypothetical protein
MCRTSQKRREEKKPPNPLTGAKQKKRENYDPIFANGGPGNSRVNPDYHRLALWAVAVLGLLLVGTLYPEKAKPGIVLPHATPGFKLGQAPERKEIELDFVGGRQR